jgi:hypothetical protein
MDLCNLRFCDLKDITGPHEHALCLSSHLSIPGIQAATVLCTYPLASMLEIYDDPEKGKKLGLPN